MGNEWVKLFMKEQDRGRFRAYFHWFNQFLDGIRDIYEMVVNQLPPEFFSSADGFTSDNYYFPRQKVAPSIPPYYALSLEGFKCALQIVTIIDSSLIARNGFFLHEPSIIIVLHTQAYKYSWVDEFALNVARNRNVRSIRKVNGIIWGQIKSEYPADFFAFQRSLDKFSNTDNPQEAVRLQIVNPIIENLRKGFPNPPA